MNKVQRWLLHLFFPLSVSRFKRAAWLSDEALVGFLLALLSDWDGIRKGCSKRMLRAAINWQLSHAFLRWCSMLALRSHFREVVHLNDINQLLRCLCPLCILDLSVFIRLCLLVFFALLCNRGQQVVTIHCECVSGRKSRRQLKF